MTVLSLTHNGRRRWVPAKYHLAPRPGRRSQDALPVPIDVQLAGPVARLTQLVLITWRAPAAGLGWHLRASVPAVEDSPAMCTFG